MASATEDDRELLQRTADGDRDAFAALFRKYQRLVYRFARQMSGCAATADDVTQDVFVALMRNSRHFDPAMGALSTYLYAVARRMVRRRLVWRSRQVPIDQEMPGHVVEAGDDPLAALARQRALETLRRAILSLPVHYREVVVLCELDGLSYAEAADIVQCRVGTIRSRLSRARALLARKLSDQASDLEPVTERGRSTRCIA